MFSFKRAALALITLLAFAGLIIGIGMMVAGCIIPSLTVFGSGAMVLIVALSVVAGLE